MTTEALRQKYEKPLEKVSSKTPRMFPFITRTWNPVKYCSHNCTYGWCPRYLDKEPTLRENRMHQRFLTNDFVFVCDCGDLFCPEIPDEWITRVIRVTNENPQATFLFLTKAPSWMYDWVKDMGLNCIIGATIESDANYPSLSKAEPQKMRLQYMKAIHDKYPQKRLFVSIEPVLDFDLVCFELLLERLEPWAVAIGYDNYNHRLHEPRLSKAEKLRDDLRAAGIGVYEKTMRKAWWEESP